MASISHAADWGNFKGKFVYEGTPPTPQPIVITKDLEYCGKFPDDTVDQTLLTGPERGVRNIYVWLKTTSSQNVSVHPDLITAAATPAKLDNLHCMFAPHCIGLWAGKQGLEVINSDPIGQAVKIDCLRNASINSLMPIGGKFEHQFQTPESIPCPISCGVHPWESGYVLLHNSPYFAISDQDGAFTIANLPTGEWTFQFWHEKIGYFAIKPEWEKGRLTTTIKAGDNDLGTLTIKPEQFVKSK
ncbi:MAG TPA: hypothetical protein VG713_14015 [Pirellulales bacterium]|nr:hypothetical protein [Pirellulales bacterium]